MTLLISSKSTTTVSSKINAILKSHKTQLHEPEVVVHSYKPSSQEVAEFKDSFNYRTRLCFKNIKANNTSKQKQIIYSLNAREENHNIM